MGDRCSGVEIPLREKIEARIMRRLCWNWKTMPCRSGIPPHGAEGFLVPYWRVARACIGTKRRADPQRGFPHRTAINERTHVVTEGSIFLSDLTRPRSPCIAL